MREDIKIRDKGKRMLMWCGVSFFMIIISFFWIMNLRYTFKVSAQTKEENSSLHELKEVKQDFSKTLDEIKKGFSEVKKIIKDVNIASTTKVININE